MRHIFFTLLLISLFSRAALVSAQTGWYELGGRMSDLHDVSSAVTRDASGTLYAAMGFGVFKWTGGNWVELGSGLSALNANGYIHSICTDAAGNVYAAGYFLNALNKSYVAKWNGSSWSQVGTGANALNGNGQILSITCDAAGNLYAAGEIYDANVRGYVAKWNGTTWTELGTGANALNVQNRPIYSIAVDAAGNVYATVDYHYTTNRKYVARWNGTTWSELGGTGASSLNANNPIHAIAIDATGNIYVAGEFTNVSGKRYVAKWNGTAWSQLGTGSSALNGNGDIYSLTTDPSGNVYAGGIFYNTAAHSYVAKWNGSSWSEIGSGAGALNADGTITAIVADGAGTVVATGSIVKPAGQWYVSMWNGTAWSEMGNGSGALNATADILALCSDRAGNIYAAGKFGSDSAQRAVAKWNGASWTTLGTGVNATIFFNDITTLATDSVGNVYAAGLFTTSSANRNNVVKWDGSSWTEVGAPNPLNANRQIYTIAFDKKGNLYATGNFTNTSGKYYVAKWDGATWSELGGINALSANYTIYGLASDTAGNIYAGGVFTNSSGKKYVAKFDGTSWSELGGPNSLKANDYILTIATDPAGNVYAGGAFYSAPPVGKDYVAKWDHNLNAWSELGGSDHLNPGTIYTGDIQSIVTDAAGHVYATGHFPDSTMKSFVAKWNDTAWVELGIPSDPLHTCQFQNINAIVLDTTGNVYTAGGFTNTRALRFVARYDQRVIPSHPVLVPNIATRSDDGSLVVYPNPNGGRFSLKIDVPASCIGQSMVITMSNALGQQVYSSTIRPNVSEWHMDIVPGRSLPDGLYLMQVSGDGIQYHARIAVRQ